MTTNHIQAGTQTNPENPCVRRTLHKAGNFQSNIPKLGKVSLQRKTRLQKLTVNQFFNVICFIQFDYSFLCSQQPANSLQPEPVESVHTL